MLSNSPLNLHGLWSPSTIDGIDGNFWCPSNFCIYICVIRLHFFITIFFIRLVSFNEKQFSALMPRAKLVIQLKHRPLLLLSCISAGLNCFIGMEVELGTVDRFWKYFRASGCMECRMDWFRASYSLTNPMAAERVLGLQA